VLHDLYNVLAEVSAPIVPVGTEERGLAYSSIYQTAYADAGLFTDYAGTSPDNIPQVLS
jgi:hypothetical protein